MTAPKAPGESLVVTIQDAIHETIHHSRRADGSLIPVKALAQDANIPPSTLYDCADEHRERKLRAEEIPALVRASGNALIVSTIAKACGGTYVPLPVAPSALATDVRLASDAMHEFAQTMQAFSDALADGRITETEAEQVDREGHEAISAILALMHHARARATRGGESRC